MIGCFNHQVVTLVAVNNGYEKFILVLEVNCMSNLSPNHTLQQTTLMQNICEQVTTAAFQIYDAFVVILLQMFSSYYICRLLTLGAHSAQRGL